jgi:hypothetical protein
MSSPQHLGKTCGSHIFIVQLMLRSIRDQDGCHGACWYYIYKKKQPLLYIDEHAYANPSQYSSEVS